MDKGSWNTLLRGASVIAVVGLLAGAIVAGPAAARKKGLTKKAADARYINVGEPAADLACPGCVSADDLASSEAWREVGSAGQPPFLGCGTGCWANQAPGYHTVAFFKDALGIVHLRGMARCAVASCDTGSHVVFTLPEGYRPAATMYVPAYQAGSFQAIFIDPSGGVGLPVSHPMGDVVSLENIAFRAA